MVLPYVSGVSELGYQTHVSTVQPQGCFQIRANSPLDADQGKGHTTIGEALQCCVPHPLQWMQQGLHRGDHLDVGNEAQGASGDTEKEND